MQIKRIFSIYFVLFAAVFISLSYIGSDTTDIFAYVSEEKSMNLSAESNAPGGIVSTADELNRALGGNHKVKGNTVVLQEDVVLDTDIAIQNTKQRLTLNANGKTLSDTVGGYRDISVSSAKLRITGNGSFQIRLCVWDSSVLTIENGDFLADKDVYAITREGKNSGQISTLNINDGEIGGIEAGAVNTLHINVKGGTVNQIALSEAEDNVYDPDDNLSSAQPHELVISDGNVKKVSLSGFGPKVTLKGGTIGTGGISEQGTMFDYGRLTVKNGDVIGPVKKINNVTVSGGTLSTVDCDIFTMTGGTCTGSVKANTFTMKGGLIDSKNDACAVDISHGAMYGGIIKTHKKNSYGIRIHEESDLTLTGGKIISAKGNGHSGIMLKGILKKSDYTAKQYDILLQALSRGKINLKGTKGKTFQITGFKYSVYQPFVGITAIADHTKVQLPSIQKAAYVKGQKIPRLLKGDMKILFFE